MAQLLINLFIASLLIVGYCGIFLVVAATSAEKHGKARPAPAVGAGKRHQNLDSY